MNRSLERNFERFARKGDAKALTRVFDRTARDLLSLAQHLVQHSSDAEDLVQNTFVTAIDRASSFDSKHRLRPWLAGILCNHAANLIRRRQSRAGKAESLDSEVHAIPATSSGPLTSITQNELQQQLQHALTKLPQRYRRVLEPYLVQGERPEQIARTLEEAPGTVRTQIHRGLIKLRRFLPAGILLGTMTQPRSLVSMRSAVLEHAQTYAAPGSSAPASMFASLSMGTLLSLGALTVTSISVLAVKATDRPTGDVIALTSSETVLQPKKLEIGDSREPSKTQSAKTSSSGHLARETSILEPGSGARSPGRKAIQGVASPGSVWLQGEVVGVAASDLTGIQFRLIEKSLTTKAYSKQVEQGKFALLADAQVQSDRTFRIEVTGGMHPGVEGYSLFFTHDAYGFAVADYSYTSKDEFVRVSGTDVVRKLQLKLEPVARLEGYLPRIPYSRTDYVPVNKLVQLLGSSSDGDRAVKPTKTVCALELQEMASSLHSRPIHLEASEGNATNSLFMVRRSPIAFGLFKVGHDKPLAQLSRKHHEVNLNFALTTAQGGPMLLAIASIDQTPFCMPVFLSLRRTVKLQSPIQMQHNAPLTGYVQMHRLRPERGLALIAQRILEPGQAPFTWFDQQYIWQGDQLLHFDAHTTADQSGRFAFEGLAPGTYKISVDETHLTLLDSALSSLAIRKNVQAPETNLELTLPAAQLSVFLHPKTPDPTSSPNGPVTYHFNIQQTDSPEFPSAPFELIPGGRRDILALPNTPLQITYTHDNGQDQVLWTGTSGTIGNRKRIILPELW